MGFKRTKIDKYDKTFSEFIRMRDKFCQRCGKGGRLECSHIFTRKHLTTRWDADNAKAMCFLCHRWWHENPVEAVEWLKKIVGQDKYDRLRMKAKSVGGVPTWQKDEIRKKFKQLIKKMEDGEDIPMFNERWRR